MRTTNTAGLIRLNCWAHLLNTFHNVEIDDGVEGTRTD